jgi:hypothetical protein
MEDIPRKYTVVFTVAHLGELQQTPDLRITYDDELNAAILKSFKKALKTAFPRGTLSADARTFTTAETVKLIPVGQPVHRFKVPELVRGDLLMRLSEYSGQSDFNTGTITLKPFPYVSPTAVKVVARNIQVNPSGTAMVGLPDELEQKLKGYGRTTRRRGRKTQRKRHSLSSRRKSIKS